LVQQNVEVGSLSVEVEALSVEVEWLNLEMEWLNLEVEQRSAGRSYLRKNAGVVT
jgi:hypothetical protein